MVNITAIVFCMFYSTKNPAFAGLLMTYALDKLLDNLRKRGIELDLSSAKFRDIEININFSINFWEYLQAFTIIVLQLPNPKYYR